MRYLETGDALFLCTLVFLLAVLAVAIVREPPKRDAIRLLGVTFTREEIARLKAHAAIDAQDLAIRH